MAKRSVLEYQNITDRRRLTYSAVATEQRATDLVATVINAIGRAAGSAPEFHTRKVNLEAFENEPLIALAILPWRTWLLPLSPGPLWE